ncbi:transposase [Pseudomonadota bacterium]
MARKPRIDVAGIPQHVIQRGVNRSVCFIDDFDHNYYLYSLHHAAEQHDCQIHAYVLMTNHVHLLVTGHSLGSVSAMMQCLGRRYVGKFNKRHERTGTLWEGRFKSGLVDSERYVLTCYRYIELNPVRAGIVNNPGEFLWSSVHANAFGKVDKLVDPHPVFQMLGPDKASRMASYRDLLAQDMDKDEITSIRNHVNQGKALGSRKFQLYVESLTGLSATLVPTGRPRKS